MVRAEVEDRLRLTLTTFIRDIPHFTLKPCLIDTIFRHSILLNYTQLNIPGLFHNLRTTSIATMDFAALMAKEISKAKGPPKDTSKPAQTTKDASPQPSTTTSKYMRRADLEAARLAAYEAEQAKIAADREARAALKRKHEEEEAEKKAAREEKKRKLAEESKARREAEEKEAERKKRRRLGLPEAEEDATSKEGTPMDGNEVTEDIPEEELITRLRAMNEPITLFGETQKTRLKRYNRLLAKQRALASAPKFSTGPIPTTITLLPESEMAIPPQVPKDANPETLSHIYAQLASYFTLVFTEWERALASREDAVKQSTQGKLALNAMLQARENMKPLFRLFESGQLPSSILTAIVEIVHAAQRRRYVDANDGYLRLSIGKAAWPIGVTMVGIHERSAREKLHESDKSQAHIMADESTRKYLQSIKRCLSFAQTRWPPEDVLQLMG